jgi:hypothetical protein
MIIGTSQNPNNIDLGKLLQQADQMKDALQWHIVIQNKVNIWCNIFNNMFPIFFKYVTFITSTAIAVKYAWKHLIEKDIIDELMRFLTSQNDCFIIGIICATLVSIFFIKAKYSKH